MNERERRANQSLRTLDEAHRNGRITREDYRARRRALLGSLCDSDGVTARNALTPAAARQPRDGGAQRAAVPVGDMATALFPDRRRLAAEGGCRPADRLHPRPDARGDPGGENDRPGGSAALRGNRSGAGRGSGRRHFLIGSGPARAQPERLIGGGP